jgi:hypothetical protein
MKTQTEKYNYERRDEVPESHNFSLLRVIRAIRGRKRLPGLFTKTLQLSLCPLCSDLCDLCVTPEKL